MEVLLETEIAALEGGHGVLDAIRCRHVPSGNQTRLAVRHLFLFIGAEPNTAWLSGSGVAIDEKGFVLTGADVAPGRRALETSVDGVFAVGDVRLGSTKRVAAAVGERAQEEARWLIPMAGITAIRASGHFLSTLIGLFAADTPSLRG